MDSDGIRAGVTGIIGKRIVYFDTVSSTNTVALGFDAGVEDGTVVISDRQEKGRGRHGRSWVSPGGVNIYMSVLLRPRMDARQLTLLTLLASVACTHALRQATGLAVSVKWPNDLMAGGRKLGGILTEIKTAGREAILAVIGIGINVAMEERDFPEDIRTTATSLFRETGRRFSRELLITGILNEMDRWYGAFRSGGSSSILSEWQTLSSTLGTKVRVTTGQETFTGIAEAVDETGLLIVKLPSGERRTISSADISVLT